jgi:hypothetical protein
MCYKVTLAHWIMVSPGCPPGEPEHRPGDKHPAQGHNGNEIPIEEYMTIGQRMVDCYYFTLFKGILFFKPSE